MDSFCSVSSFFGSISAGSDDVTGSDTDDVTGSVTITSGMKIFEVLGVADGTAPDLINSLMSDILKKTLGFDDQRM